MKCLKLVSIIFFQLLYFSCTKTNGDRQIPNVKLIYVGLSQRPLIERYVVDGLLDPFKKITNINDPILNQIIKPYFDTITKFNGVQSLHFKNDTVTIEKYTNGIFSGTEDLYFTNDPYDIRIYKSDPAEPLYRGGVSLNDTIELSTLLAFTLKNKSSIKNIKSSVYLMDEFLKNSFVESAISDFNLAIGDTLYLQHIYLKYAPD